MRTQALSFIVSIISESTLEIKSITPETSLEYAIIYIDDLYGHLLILCVCVCVSGNLGSTLSSSTSTRGARLYFSRDGGFTWAEVRSGLYEFQFAALGSVVVAVQKNRYVRSVWWTCDEGATWQASTFVDSNFPRGIIVIGMRTEAGEKARHVT